MSRDSSTTTASIVVPTRARLDYLRVTLASIAPQAARAGAELIVVDDAGPSEQGRRLARRFGARYEPHPRPLGLNVARNTGVECSTGDLVVFVDDDVEVHDRWLMALLSAAAANPDVEVFTGPIVPRLEGSPPHSCGREGAPITALDLGLKDTRTRYAWGANMAIRRSALERIGRFDVSLEHGGDEQEWQERLAADHASRDRSDNENDEHDRDARGTGESVLYVAAAGLDHRRAAADARLHPLCRAAYTRGRAARRFDVWRGQAPSFAQELRTLAGCAGHVIRRRCPAGMTMVAHSAGRVRETRVDAIATNRTARTPPGDDFLSGESGTVGGLDAWRRRASDLSTDVLRVASGRCWSLDRAARHSPPNRRVLVLCVERPGRRALVDAIRAQTARSRHAVEFHTCPPGDRGKFENLNLLLDAHPPGDHDWLLVIDDDITLPHNFLDRFLFLAERFGLDLAQPAHQLASHAAWKVTRRHRSSVVRETRFVEIGPLTGFARSTFSTLLPFPALRMGWGLDMHWAAIAREHDWRCGVIDAVPIGHREAPAASAYSREQALEEARTFLRNRPYLRAAEAQQTLVTHRRW